MKHKLLSLVLALLSPVFCFPQYTPKQQAKAARIHKGIFTIDSHDDTPMNLFEKGFDLAKDNSISIPHSCVDIPRMEKGGLDAIFFAVFEGQGPRTPEGNARALKSALATFDSIQSAVKRCEKSAGLALTSSDGYRLEKESRKAIYIGVENGYPIGRDIKNVKLFYDRGARYVTLCHTKNNDICTSSTDTNNTLGLSAFGKQVVVEMNRLGMMVDISHVSDASFYDVLKISKTPLIASHSCSRTLCKNPRNLSDDMLRALAKDGGVIQMCILSAYVKTPPPYPARDSAIAVVRHKWRNFQNLSDMEMDSARHDWYSIDGEYPQPLATVSDVCDHIDHIVKVAGINHVGIGTDFDGGGGVEGCEDAGQMGNITLELVKRGYNKRRIAKIWGGNLMKVMRKVEQQAGL